MIEIDKLKKYASDLNFSMNEEEYITLSQEFDIFLKQMELIGNIPNIEKIKPLTHPFAINSDLREDKVTENLSKELAFSNTKNKENNTVKLPRIVG